MIEAKHGTVLEIMRNREVMPKCCECESISPPLWPVYRTVFPRVFAVHWIVFGRVEAQK
jgi:hypothetical protein